MTEELSENLVPQKQKRPYNRKQPSQIHQQSSAPNPNIVALEGDYVTLVRKRSSIAVKVNQANMQLQFAQNELSQIDGEIQFLANSIAQMKNGGMPVPQTPYVAHSMQPQYVANSSGFGYQQPSSPYNPVTPYPTMPSFDNGVGSFPGQNRGLYPDATDRLESAEEVRQLEIWQRGL